MYVIVGDDPSPQMLLAHLRDTVNKSVC